MHLDGSTEHILAWTEYSEPENNRKQNTKKNKKMTKKEVLQKTENFIRDVFSDAYTDVTDALDKLIKAFDSEPYWHEGEPIEDGWYETVRHYERGDVSKTFYETSLFRNGKWYEGEDQAEDYPCPAPTAWHKILEYKAENNTKERKNV